MFIKKRLTDDEQLLKLVETTNIRIRSAVDRFIRDNNLSNRDIADMFYPAILSSNQVCKIRNDDTRHWPIELLVGLHYMYGFSLDECIAGNKSHPILSDEFKNTILNLARMLEKN